MYFCHLEWMVGLVTFPIWRFWNYLYIVLCTVQDRFWLHKWKHTHEWARVCLQTSSFTQWSKELKQGVFRKNIGGPSSLFHSSHENITKGFNVFGIMMNKTKIASLWGNVTWYNLKWDPDWNIIILGNGNILSLSHGCNLNFNRNLDFRSFCTSWFY